MIREDEVRNIVGNMREPFLHRPLGELDAIKEVKIKPEKRHVSVKIALAKRGRLNRWVFSRKSYPF